MTVKESSEQCSAHKRLGKTMSSSYHIEQKVFIEASCTNNKQTGENFFGASIFKGLWVNSFQTE